MRRGKLVSFEEITLSDRIAHLEKVNAALLEALEAIANMLPTNPQGALIEARRAIKAAK